MFSRDFSYFCSVKKSEKQNKKKPVKKNTWRRKLKAFDLRLNRRLRERNIDPVDDETVRVCPNCSKEFTGRFCPQCGQDASWKTFSWKQERHNVLNYLGLCKDVISHNLKKAKNRKPKKMKPVKKNTWKRKLKALDLRISRRQRDRSVRTNTDETVRTCSNCGEQYKGRYCPQCGQAGAWDRYSWRRVILNFLDIWGLGNRPMFRTVQELFWRPGYMVRDYLRGHRQLYFPPFKLLAVSIALTLFVNLLTGNEFESVIGTLVEAFQLKKIDSTPTINAIAHGVVSIGEFLTAHPLYDVMIMVLFMVCCIRVAFRRAGDYNFVETFIFMVFVFCQIFIFNLFSTPIESLYNLVENQLLMNKTLTASPFWAGIGGLVSIVAGLISSAFNFFMAILYVCDFRQFYGLSWKSTIWRMVYAVVVAFAAIGVLIAIGTIIYQKGVELGMCSAFLVILFLVAYTITSNYLHKNKFVVNKFIYLMSKLPSSLLLVAMPLISYLVSKKICGYNNVWIVASTALVCSMLAAAIAILPSYLYKKYHRS